ncbi:hypothetical protein [Prosthecobacter sp.]|uniref:hypothetical protein n=1 Tax=Prosthecobacter sp. TaxID=1965333 RepID=UPI002ABCEF7D|nr:hypothetical protein [Prosthecobacter sp.]MDZ4404580.1 hypothetical protein [Prosthecobacter sp.]
MNIAHFIFTLLSTGIVSLAGTEQPSVSVYQLIKPDPDNLHFAGPELALKISNPTDRTFFVLGSSITDIPHVIETKKNGKWVLSPPTRCGTGMELRRFLADSYIIFDVWDAPVHEEDVTFRVRVYLYTESNIWNVYTDPAKKPYIEILSQEFSSNDFQWKPTKTSPEEEAARAAIKKEAARTKANPYTQPSLPMPPAAAQMSADPFGKQEAK